MVNVLYLSSHPHASCLFPIVRHSLLVACNSYLKTYNSKLPPYASCLLLKIPKNLIRADAGMQGDIEAARHNLGDFFGQDIYFLGCDNHLAQCGR